MAQSLKPVAAEFVGQLCPQCAMCCNGVLFKDVELQPGDDRAKLRALGLPLTPRRAPRSALRTQKFPQPCAALDGCTCRIYADRPGRCRGFDCALLQALAAGETDTAAALRVIQRTRGLAEKVRRLLRESGDTDEQLSLSRRFRRTQRRLESLQLDDDTAEIFGQLTLAVHDLNLALRQHFYPAAHD